MNIYMYRCVWIICHIIWYFYPLCTRLESHLYNWVLNKVKMVYRQIWPLPKWKSPLCQKWKSWNISKFLRSSIKTKTSPLRSILFCSKFNLKNAPVSKGFAVKSMFNAKFLCLSQNPITVKAFGENNLSGVSQTLKSTVTSELQ